MRFDRVITLCDKVRERCPDLPDATTSAHWSIADPAAEGTDEAAYPAFQRVADDIESRVVALMAELGTQPTSIRPTRRTDHAR
jgi:protein-tyrosine-phosphatase